MFGSEKAVPVRHGLICVTTSLSPTRKLACEVDLGDCRTPKGFALRCETELKTSRSQPARFLEVFLWLCKVINSSKQFKTGGYSLVIDQSKNNGYRDNG